VSQGVSYNLSSYSEISYPLIHIIWICFKHWGHDEFNELDTQDHIINGDTNKKFGSSPTGSIG
jgi:hypothetical protein